MRRRALLTFAVAAYERKDAVYRRAKREGFRSRAALKLEEIDALFSVLKPGLRIGTMVSSIARVYLGKRDIATIPFTFEDEMVEFEIKEGPKGLQAVNVIRPEGQNSASV